MKAPILALTLLAAFSCSAAAQVLENEDLRLEVSAGNGSIIGVADKRTGTDYIQDRARARLFRLDLSRPDFTARHYYRDGPRSIESHEQKVESVAVHDGTLTIRFRRLQISPRSYGYMIVESVAVPEAPREIEVAATFRLEGAHIVSRLEVANHGAEEISGVTFPWLGGLATRSGGAGAKVILPSLSRRSISGTLGGFAGGRAAKPYPALLATSWINYEFEDRGIGIEVRTAPETQNASLSLSPASGPFIAWDFYPHIAGQSRWTSPDAVIHLHGSDWHTMAGEHREWYREQFPPPPHGAFDDAIGFATYRLKRDDNTINWTYDEIPKLAEDAGTAGIRRLVLQGWREREGPGNPSPFGEVADPRMGGAPRLKAVVDRLHREGIEPAFAFHPTLINTATEQYEKSARRWTVRSRVQGNQLSTSYVFISRDYPYEDYGSHYWAQLDPASPATDYLLREAERMKNEYGFRSLFLRGVGLPSFLSYNYDTGVPPHQTYAVGYARLLGGLKRLFPEGVLIAEGFNDLVNGYASAGYTWSQTNEAEVLAFSIPWVSFSNDVEALNYDQANASFARKILINLIVDGGDGTVRRYPDFARHLKALQRLKQVTAPYYAKAEFRDHEGLKKLTADSEVTVSVFRNRSGGQAGIVLANLSAEKKRAYLELDSRAVRAQGRLFRLAGTEEQIGLARGFTVVLDPEEVVVLGVDPE